MVGVDIGQKHDPTAIAVTELSWRLGAARLEDHWIVRHLESLPLMTPYPDVAARVESIVTRLQSPRPRPWYKPDADDELLLTLYVDATGVGQPIVDLLAGAGVRPMAVYFTHGEKRTVENKEVKLGKAWLVSRLQALLQTRRLHLPDTPVARQLAKELQDYEIKIDQNANDTYGAFKVGTHDDLVTALGLTVQGPGAGMVEPLSQEVVAAINGE